MSPPRPGPYNIVSRGPAGMFALTFRGEHAPCEVQPFRPGAPDQTVRFLSSLSSEPWLIRNLALCTMIQWHVKPTGPDTMSIEPIIGDELECATLGEFVGIMPKNGAVWSIRSAPPEGEYT